jgi:hypothetical protein
LGLELVSGSVSGSGHTAGNRLPGPGVRMNSRRVRFQHSVNGHRFSALAFAFIRRLHEGE